MGAQRITQHPRAGKYPPPCGSVLNLIAAVRRQLHGSIAPQKQYFISGGKASMGKHYIIRIYVYIYAPGSSSIFVGRYRPICSIRGGSRKLWVGGSSLCPPSLCRRKLKLETV